MQNGTSAWEEMTLGGKAKSWWPFQTIHWSQNLTERCEDDMEELLVEALQRCPIFAQILTERVHASFALYCFPIPP
jgi:hypothetical protein